MQLTHRPRRLRRNPSIRSLVREAQLSVDDFIYPMFVMEGENERVEIPSMPEAYRFTLDLLVKEIEEILECLAKGPLPVELFDQIIQLRSYDETLADPRNRKKT